MTIGVLSDSPANKHGPSFAPLTLTAIARPPIAPLTNSARGEFLMDQMIRRDDETGAQQTLDHLTEQTSQTTTLDTIKDTVANKLHAAAGVIQQKASQSPNTTAGSYAGQAANWLGDAAEYVRDADPQKLKSDLQNQVRHNPGRSLLVAGAAGLLLGFLIRR